MRKHLVAFVIVFGCTAGAAAGQTSAAGALADAFVDAWNTHNLPLSRRRGDLMLARGLSQIVSTDWRTPLS